MYPMVQSHFHRLGDHPFTTNIYEEQPTPDTTPARTISL